MTELTEQDRRVVEFSKLMREAAPTLEQAGRDFSAACADLSSALQRCGLLDSEKEGRRVYYNIAEPHLENIMACLEARFGQE